jgi:hypothetical protein
VQKSGESQEITGSDFNFLQQSVTIIVNPKMAVYEFCFSLNGHDYLWALFMHRYDFKRREIYCRITAVTRFEPRQKHNPGNNA